MPKFEVHVFGTVPQIVEVEAPDKDSAEGEATMEVLNRLDFKAVPLKEENKADGN
jgi:hypothetical protein